MSRRRVVTIPKTLVAEYEHMSISLPFSKFVQAAVGEKIDRERRDILARGLEVVSDEKAEEIE